MMNKAGRIIIIVLCVAAALSIVAFAFSGVFFGLRDALPERGSDAPETVTVPMSTETDEEPETVADPESTETVGADISTEESAEFTESVSQPQNYETYEPGDPSFGTRTNSAERAAGAAGSSKIVIDFVGDVMLANDQNEPDVLFNTLAGKVDPSYFMGAVAGYLSEDDFTVANLENTFTDRVLEKCYKGYDPAYWYCSATKNAEILNVTSIEAVSIANNHTGDYGADGYSDTVAALNRYGIEYGDESQILYLEKDGFRIAVICTGMWSDWDAGKIPPRIAEASLHSDFQIVFYHGGTEYLHAPEEWKVRACKELIDAGADCVVGSHPHVIQPIGRYRGVDIVYSLGNFFGGDFKTCEAETFIYRLTINVRGTSFVSSTSEIIPCLVYDDRIYAENNFKTIPVYDDRAAKIVSFVDWETDSPA